MMESTLVFDEQDSPNLYRVIKHLVQDKIKDFDSFNVNIDEKDEMFLNPIASYKQTHPHAPEQDLRDLAVRRYFNVGIEIGNIVKQLVDWKFNGFDRINTFFDFACGYGRYTRFLIQQMPAQNVWVSDIYADAVSFQKKQFGVNGIVSQTNPDDFSIATTFECILVVSLFSHLPEALFLLWLRKLYDQLRPGGMLLFSVIDASFKRADVRMNENGFGYVRRSESRTLNTEQYGGAFVTEEFVKNAIDQVTDGKARYLRWRRGICNHQDLYVLINDDTDFSNLFVKSAWPMGNFGLCAFKGNHLHLGGWAITNDPHAWVADIQIIVNGKIVQRCMPSIERPQIAERFNSEHNLISGWNCACYLDDSKTDQSTDVLTIKLISSDGIEKNIFSGTIEEALSPDRIKRSI